MYVLKLSPTGESCLLKKGVAERVRNERLRELLLSLLAHPLKNRRGRFLAIRLEWYGEPAVVVPLQAYFWIVVGKTKHLCRKTGCYRGTLENLGTVDLKPLLKRNGPESMQKRVDERISNAIRDAASRLQDRRLGKRRTKQLASFAKLRKLAA